nr:PAS domain S-box protein [Nitrosopumilus sp.]
FPDRLLVRPYDLVPLGFYLFLLLYLLPRYIKKHPSIFSKTLLLSMIPAIIAQLHMAFGSHQIFDDNFFSAYSLRILSSIIPFIGLGLNYYQTHIREKGIIVNLNEEVEQREKSESTLKGVIESSNNGIQVYESVKNSHRKIIDFRCILANKISAEISGIEIKELQNGLLFSQYPFFSDSGYLNKYLGMVETGGELIYEYYYEKLQKWYYIIATKLHDGFTVTFTDITERKFNELHLISSEDKYRSIVESAQDAIIVSDADGYIMSWNKGAEKIFQFSEDEVIGKELTLIMPEKYHSPHREGMRRHLETGETKVIGKVVELEGIRKNGEIFPVELALTNWSSFEGLFFTGIIRDISQRKEAEHTLEEHRYFIEQVTNSITAIISVYDLEKNKNLYVNAELFNVLGYGIEIIDQLGGREKAIAKLLHPDDLKIVADRNSKLINAGNDAIIEDTLRIKDAWGNYRWFQAKSKVFKRNADGGVIHVLTTSQDITLLKNTTLELEQKNQQLIKFRTALDHSVDIIFIIHPDSYSIMDINLSACKNLGFEKEELLSKSFFDIMPQLSQDDFVKAVRSAKNLMNTISIENFLCKKDNSKIEVEILLAVVKIEDQNIIVASARDITARKETQDLIRKSEQLLREAQEMANLGNWEWYIESNMLVWSEEMYRIFGIDPEQVNVHLELFLKKIHPDDRSYVETLLKDIRKNKNSQKFQYRIILPSGDIRYLSGHVKAILDENREVEKLAGVSQDITEQVLSEEKVRQN